MAVAIDFDAVQCAEQVRSPRPFALASRAAIGLPSPSVVFSCLVVTGDAGLRRRLSAAAELVGWDSVESPPSTAELIAACQRDHRLIVVDLATSPPGDRDACRAAVERLAARPDTLVVVCGSVEEQAHEVWARSLGAFVFVPGIAAGDPLVAVLREARTVSARLHAPSIEPSFPSASHLSFARS